LEPTHRCANCGGRASDAFCPACGQNTRERLPTFPQFMREATGRYIAYDGKYWKTLAALLFRPGFLTREYLAGRRQRYIGPARLFLVSSLVLFATLRLATDSINIVETVPGDPPKAPKTKIESGELLTLDDDFNVNVGDLAGTSGILRKPIERFNRLPRAQKLEQIVAGTLRYGPYAMFALLPAFAVLLKVTAVLVLWALVYLAWSTRAVYGGRWLGIAARALVLGVAYAFLFAMVTIGLAIAKVLMR
jgi:hypothetical protein